MRSTNYKKGKMEEVKTSPKTAQDFAKAYQELCDQMGFRIVVNPVWVSTNHGSFEMTLQYSVGQLPKEQNGTPNS